MLLPTLQQDLALELPPQQISLRSRRYLGNKTKLIPFLRSILLEVITPKSFIDVFSGTGVVAEAFNKEAKVVTNDILFCNYTCHRAWLGAESVRRDVLVTVLNELNSIKPSHNYCSKTFGGTFFELGVAQKIGAARAHLEHLRSNLADREYYILLSSILYAADKAANTCGHFDAFCKSSFEGKDTITFCMPDYHSATSNKGNVQLLSKAEDMVDKHTADIVYLDPPYNSRQYVDSYHVLENLALWKKPKVEGITRKMTDRVSKKSEFCLKNAPSQLASLVAKIQAKFIAVSYNNMGQKGNSRSNAKVTNSQLTDLLKTRGEVRVYEKEYPVFQTGKSVIGNHKELLFLCTTR